MCFTYYVPRKTKYASFFKYRSKPSWTPTKLYFGQIGLQSSQALMFTTRQLFRYVFWLKKASRRSEKTQRFFWINLFTNYPLTRKPKSSRMGKGKGKFKTWVAPIKPGLIIFEFKNIRVARSIYFFNQLRAKINSSLRIYLQLHYLRQRWLFLQSQFFFSTFWV